MVRLVAVLALSGLSSGCMYSVACDLVVTPAITLTILDANSELRVPGAEAEATRWTSHFTFVGESGIEDLELHGSAGTYTVTVRRAGYEEWVQTGVTVLEYGGSCPSPITESLEAKLVPASDPADETL